MDNIVKEYNADKKIKFSANITRVSVYSALIWCIVAVLLTSILRDMLFSYINWFFGGTLLALLTFILAKSKRRMILLGILVALILVHLPGSYNISREIKDSMNWLSCIEFLILCCDQKSLNKIQGYLERSETLIKYVLYIYTVELLTIMMLPSAYTYAWGSRVFTAYNAVQGTAANCCLYIAIALYYIGVFNNGVQNARKIIQKNLFILFGILLNLAAIIMTQIRTVLFSVLAAMVLFIMILFKDNVKRFLVFIISGLLGIIVLLNSDGFRAKMLYSIQQLSFAGFTALDALLSSRPIIWKRLLTYFWKEDSFFNYLFGSGFARVYEINIVYGNGRNINAHSDIIHTFIGFGITGLSVMLIYSFRILSFKTKQDWLGSLVLLLFAIIPEAINGIMMTPSHVYSVLFIILVLNILHIRRNTRYA